MKKYVFFSIMAALLAVSCSKNAPQEVELVKLGGKPKTVKVGAGSDVAQFEVISNVPYTARIVQGNNWISFPGGNQTMSGEGNGNITVILNANTGIKRTAKIVLEYSTRSDTLRVNQECLPEYDEYVKLSETSVTIPPEGGDVEIGVTTNVMRHLITPFAYSERILGLGLRDGKLYFRADANDTYNPVNTKVTLTFINGWEEPQVAAVTVFQGFI